MTAKSNLMALAASVAILLIGGAVWLAAAQLSGASSKQGLPIADTNRTGAPIKVGVIVTGNTSQPAYGAHGNEAIAEKLKDPQIDLYAIIDPGTAEEEDVVAAIKAYFPAGHVINGDDPKELRKMNVIVASRAWFMREDVLDAIKEAVSDGVGFLYQSQIGFQHPGMFTEAAITLQGMTNVRFFAGPMGKLEGVIVSKHPLLGSLASKVGTRIYIGHTMGPMGDFNGTPLIASPNVQGRSGQPSGELEHKPVEMAGWPTTQVSNEVFYPLLVSECGKGRIVGCNWHDPVAPPELDRAHGGRFYIHCVQWLANRPLD